MSEKTLIPAVLYLRKSTKGVRKDGKEKQEKSLGQQRKELAELAKRDGYSIVRTYEDAGISGWKRGAQRPGFDQMLSDARERRDFNAILCDDLDRLSRAEVMEVFADLSALAACGVNAVHAVNQGRYSLGENEIGRIIKLVVDVHGGNEFSKKLSRRIALARRNMAKEGKVSGGPAPYGLKLDGKGGLVHGDKPEIRIVRRIFDEFVTKRASLNSIAGGLNRDGLAGPRGNCWYTRTVRGVITRVAYRGDFEYGSTRQGRFYTMNDAHDVVPATDRGDVPKAKRIVREGIFKPLIDPKMFDAAQRRLATLGTSRSVRKRVGYALTGVIVCDHCNRPCYGLKQSKHVVYRCNSKSLMGKGGCGNYQIREDVILPFVMNLLSQEVKNVEKLIETPPEKLRNPRRENLERRERVEREIGELDRRIQIATRNLMTSTADERTRKAMDAEITLMRNERQELAAQLEVDPAGKVYSKSEFHALKEWWKEFTERAISIPVSSPLPLEVEAFAFDPFADGRALLVNPLAVNAALLDLGAEVRLQWDSEKLAIRTRHTIACGRFRLGQQKGRIPDSVSTPSAPGTWSGGSLRRSQRVRGRCIAGLIAGVPRAPVSDGSCRSRP